MAILFHKSRLQLFKLLLNEWVPSLINCVPSERLVLHLSSDFPLYLVLVGGGSRVQCYLWNHTCQPFEVVNFHEVID